MKRTSLSWKGTTTIGIQRPKKQQLCDQCPVASSVCPRIKGKSKRGKKGSSSFSSSSLENVENARNSSSAEERERERETAREEGKRKRERFTLRSEKEGKRERERKKKRTVANLSVGFRQCYRNAKMKQQNKIRLCGNLYVGMTEIYPGIYCRIPPPLPTGGLSVIPIGIRPPQPRDEKKREKRREKKDLSSLSRRLPFLWFLNVVRLEKKRKKKGRNGKKAFPLSFLLMQTTFFCKTFFLLSGADIKKGSINLDFPASMLKNPCQQIRKSNFDA